MAASDRSSVLGSVTIRSGPSGGMQRNASHLDGTPLPSRSTGLTHVLPRRPLKSQFLAWARSIGMSPPFLRWPCEQAAERITRPARRHPPPCCRGTASGWRPNQRNAAGVSRAQRLIVVLVLNLGLVAALVTVGIAAHSLAVLAEGGDYLLDAAGVTVALLAIRLSARPARRARPNGHATPTDIAALVNCGWLLVLEMLVVAAAAERLITR